MSSATERRISTIFLTFTYECIDSGAMYFHSSCFGSEASSIYTRIIENCGDAAVVARNCLWDIRCRSADTTACVRLS